MREMKRLSMPIDIKGQYNKQKRKWLQNKITKSTKKTTDLLEKNIF